MAAGGEGRAAQALQPVERAARVVALDALRGLAILGILLVNIQFFQGPEPYLQLAGERVWEGADRIAYALTVVFAQGKFISMFSIMFGAGIAIQAERAERRGRNPTGLLIRRLLVLAAFGAMHGILIWAGDILLTYALVGLVLLLFRGRAVKTLLIWIGALLGVPALLILMSAGLAAVAGVVPGGSEALGNSQAPLLASARELAETLQQAYTSGSYRQMVAARLDELEFAARSFVFSGVWILGLMLLGMAAVRSGIVEDLAGHATTVRRITVVGLVVGLPLNAAMAAGLLADPSGTTAPGLLAQALVLLAPPILALGYLGLGGQAFSRTPEASLTRRFAAVGRMALTNYLLQSVIATIVFYGLAQYGQWSLVKALGLCMAIYAGQLIWSPRWLSRFRYGPMEWLWRRLTYGRLPGTPTDTGAVTGGAHG